MIIFTLVGVVAVLLLAIYFLVVGAGFIKLGLVFDSGILPAGIFLLVLGCAILLGVFYFNPLHISFGA